MFSEIAFISDIQEPIYLENLFNKVKKDFSGTRALFNDISTRKPKSLFLLGDIVAFGSSNKSWEKIDKQLLILKSKKIPYFAIPGNHDYMILSSLAIPNYLKHFPENSLYGYSKIVDSLGIVMLNSNFSKLSDLVIKNQNNWLDNILDSLSKLSTVKSIIVCTHHSPYTNSTIVSSSIEVQQNFLPIFKKYKKAKLFLTGHSHNLEHFKESDKDYLVLGGGGGAMQNLRTSDFIKDDLIQTNQRLIYFYLIIKQFNNELIIIERGFNTDKSKFEEIEIARISIK